MLTPTTCWQGGDRTLVLKGAEQRPRLVRRLVAAAVADGRPGGLVLEAQFVTERLSAALQPFTKHVRKLRLGTLSLRKLLGQTGRGAHVPAPSRSMASAPAMDEGALWEHVWSGGQPALLDVTANWDDFYSAWERELLEHELVGLLGRRDAFRFLNLMSTCAKRTAQPLNLDELCDEAELEPQTAEAWINLLEDLGIVCLVPPLASALGRRASSRAGRTPLLHFMDTELACHLASLDSPDGLRFGPLYRPMLRSFVTSEVMKTWLAAGRELAGFSYLFDGEGRELDLVLREGDVLHPVKVDMGRSARADEAQKEFSSLQGVDGCELGWGEVVCLARAAGVAGRGVVVTPVWQI